MVVRTCCSDQPLDESLLDVLVIRDSLFLQLPSERLDAFHRVDEHGCGLVVVVERVNDFLEVGGIFVEHCVVRSAKVYDLGRLGEREEHFQPLKVSIRLVWLCKPVERLDSIVDVVEVDEQTLDALLAARQVGPDPRQLAIVARTCKIHIDHESVDLKEALLRPQLQTGSWLRLVFGEGAWKVCGISAAVLSEKDWIILASGVLCDLVL